MIQIPSEVKTQFDCTLNSKCDPEEIPF